MPQQGRQRHVHPDQHHPVGERGQIEVGGAGDLHSIDVDELVVEYVAGEQHLAGAALVLAQVQARGAQRDPPGVHLLDGVGGQERVTAADPYDQAGHRRVGLGAVEPGDDIDDPADLLARPGW